MASIAMRHLTVRVPRLKIRYSPEKVPLFREAEVLSNQFHPRRPKFLAQFESVPSDILRWVVVTDVSTKTLPLSTQRVRLRRRWSAAIIEALRQQGMNIKGWKLSSGQYEEDKDKDAVPILKGTMEVVVFEGYGHDETAETLVRHSAQIVQALLRARNSTR